jgi:chemotaxis protein methyltransferase CheR
MSAFLSEHYYEKFRRLIYDESGIHFNDSNRAILESRLRERLRLNKDLTIAEYYNLVASSREELKALLDAVTTNLTKFFRNLPQYETLEKYVIPDLIQYKQKRSDKTLRFWSAGCSTGEEAYTNAMCLKEWLPADYNFTIMASDISLSSLMVAREGCYSRERCQDIPPAMLKKYFDEEEKGYRVKDTLKKHITFDYHNLKYESGKHDYDVIFCRNVLIYFDEKAQKAVVERFYNAMTNHSYLFIGHSESLFGLNTRFEFVKTKWACIYGKLGQ